MIPTTTLKNPTTVVPSTTSSPRAVLAEKEALASLRVLVCVAKADGELTVEKRMTLENALTGLEMPATLTPKSVLDEMIDLDVQLRLFTTPESRESLYQSALGMVHVDGVCTPAEQKMLDHIRTTLQISDEKAYMVRDLHLTEQET